MKNHLLYFLLLISTPSLAIHSLRVGNPRTSWLTHQGTIEEAVLSVRPEGLYWEYGLYLEFSARGTNYSSQDSLEVVLKFDLPAEAIVHDSWLWIGDDIAQADILDVWTATSIYEGFVNRRQDPSLLRKQSATQYELRVFPMKANERRKVKITYLMPAQWTRDYVTAGLPVNILKTSKNQVAKLSIIVWTNADWQQATIPEATGLVFSPLTDPNSGAPFLRAELPAAVYNLAPRLAFPNPMENGFYFRRYGDPQDGFYQLAIAPEYFTPAQEPKKVALLFDFTSANGSSASLMLNNAQKYLHEYLSPTDSFNLFFSNLVTGQQSPVWLPADSLTLEQTFNNLNGFISSFSNLPALLTTGIQFVQENGNDGMLLLMSNSSQYGSSAEANPLINAVMGIMDPPLPLHCIDYYTGSNYSYTNGIRYYGNEYLYRTLAQFTGGNYSGYRDAGNSVNQAFVNGFIGLNGLIFSLDFHTTLADGVCYGRFFLGGSDPEIAYRNKPILQVGRYLGNFPFRVELSGVLNNQFYQEQVQVSLGEAQLADTLSREMWFGKYIQLLETGTQTNGTILEVLESSLPERVLSLYSAFLCLEDTSQICPECYDESQLVDTDDPAAADSLFIAWPNPFVDAVQIRAQAAVSGPVRLEIFSTSGQLVHWQEAADWHADTPLLWDGRDTQGTWLPPGTYVAIVRTGNHNAVLKLIKASRP